MDLFQAKAWRFPTNVFQSPIRFRLPSAFLHGCQQLVFRRLGLSRFRLELLDDPPEKVRLLVSRYRELLDGSCTAARLIRELDVAEQLGTTEGTLRTG